MIAGVVRNV